ncbi:DNA primase [Burkholderia phage vB_BglM_WTB]
MERKQGNREGESDERLEGDDGHGHGMPDGVDHDPSSVDADRGDSNLRAGHAETSDSPFGDEDADEPTGAEQRAEQTRLSIVAKEEAGADLAESIRRKEPDLAKRARALVGAECITFPDVKWVKDGGMPVPMALSTEMNRFAALEALFGNSEHRPHLDLFKGRILDEQRRVIDDHYPIVDILEGVHHLGLRAQSADQLRKAIREWCLRDRRNDLIESLKKRLPEWDGVPRLDTALLKIFEPKDTPLNRKISRYFFTSLYARTMHPGSIAPIVLTLIGPQNAGKSFFGKLICEEIMNDRKADAVDFTLDMDQMEFLRSITGNSVVAQAGEMSGMVTKDLNKLKQFITKASDSMRHLYEGHVHQPRQWVMLMDGNEYDGLQRDRTGNRRFYPLFVGQVDDVNGKPAWKEQFRANLDTFREDIWQLLAEARAWYAEKGEKGWNAFVSDTANDVFAFSDEEMLNDRGTVRDDALEMHLRPAIRRVKAVYRRKGSKSPAGMCLAPDRLDRQLRINARINVNPVHMKTKMKSLGFELIRGTGNRLIWFAAGFESEEELHKHLGIDGSDGDESDDEQDNGGYGDGDGGF